MKRRPEKSSRIIPKWFCVSRTSRVLSPTGKTRRPICETSLPHLTSGLTSLVFVDDNPAERAIVRQFVPEVAVPELPEDVTAYPQVIEQHR